MNSPLRRAGVVVMVLFGLLFLQLNYVQGIKAEEYRTSPHNGRVRVEEYQKQRGSIEASRGLRLSVSVETDGSLKYLRTYPLGQQYAHVVGYRPVEGEAVGIERLENDWLSGNSSAQYADRLVALFTGKQAAGGLVQLSLSPAGQKAAFDQLLNNKLGVKKGAVVALDPKTGAVLAAFSAPTFDPNKLAVHDYAAFDQNFKALNADPDKPLLNRAFSETFPPGSTFKVITSAAVLNGGASPSTVLKGGAEYRSPQTQHVIRNSPGVNCPDSITLRDALRVSCNTAFSRVCAGPGQGESGPEGLGSAKIKETAEAFGFETTPTLERDGDNAMRIEPSRTGAMTDSNGADDKPVLAQSCIGQSSVRMTPLQGAMIAAAVANGGVQMRPYLIQEERGADLTTRYTAVPQKLRQAVSGPVASGLQEMMLSVVQNGTGTNAQIPGFDVGGKTGTAEAGTDANGRARPDKGLFIGYAMKNGQPIVAVAVVLDDAGSGGSAEATRIGGEVMKAVIKERGLS